MRGVISPRVIFPKTLLATLPAVNLRGAAQSVTLLAMRAWKTPALLTHPASSRRVDC